MGVEEMFDGAEPPANMPPTARNALAWIKVTVPALFAVAALFTLLQYAYDRGTSDAYGVPQILVHADPAKLHEASLIIILLLAFGAFGIMAGARFLALKTPLRVAPPVQKNAVLFEYLWRAIIAFVAAATFVFFSAPVADSQAQFKMIGELGAVIFIFWSLVDILIKQLMPRKTSWFETDENLYKQIYLVVGATLMIAFIFGGFYATGAQAARSAQWHYILRGPSPEVVLLQSSDGFVTADYDVNKNIVWQKYRWHDWRDSNELDAVRTGVLTTIQAIKTKDPSLFKLDTDQKHKGDE